jgi:hypothetical protein
MLEFYCGLADEYFGTSVVIDTQISKAHTQAAAILKAWGSNNLDLLNRNLAAAVEETQGLMADDTGESERLEMLSAIAGTMKRLLASDQIYSAAQYLPLLRHLAFPPPDGSESAFRC